ncbi:lipoprotein NlpD [Legionella busanensis]|uniref:Lipoprotein NlpD n=1 Tax=Legionella busanensis TaxID=190655 RepID=A0A378JKD8_9GAMM|nr:peptidoglycan DD-metalloendopeptidase family protein [Legionella busanensis]STX51634.1 lipoprotein NlpD [Legionella busanensis]
MRKFFYLFLLPGLVGCHERDYVAPVEELKWHSYLGRPAKHVVRSEETIYAIAFRYDLDFRELLRYNHLQKSRLHVGQVLKIPHYSSKALSWQLESRYIAKPLTHQKVPSKATGHWVWPAYGKVVSNFNPNFGKKGINIAGKKGGVVYAASSGIVAYAGNGLAGYGNLIIIKHSDQFLTAYGNNSHNRVKEGQIVKAGQIIADMGIVNRKFWGVHFEIRKAGQPVNPTEFLPRV